MTSANPIIVEATRGGAVESWHRGSFVVVDAEGRTIAHAGDIDRPTFPRSAIKAFQALAMVEAGVADAYGFDEAEIALACSSHGGEPAHVSAARSMLSKAGIDETCYECGPHWPTDESSTLELARTLDAPLPVHNNCSGKHAGMLAFARHIGADLKGYTRVAHPVQQRIAALMTELCDSELADAPCGIDGCSVPTWALPLRALALGFARFASGVTLDHTRAAAVRRIIAAVRAHPFMISGSGRFCTEIMTAVPRLFAKTGAEGVYCAAIPHAGYGIALKCDDGASRGAELLLARVLADLDVFDADERKALERMTDAPLYNRARLHVGDVHAVT